MTKILITGVNGYIGSRTAEKLLHQGFFILGIDLYSSNIDDLQKYPNFAFYKADITKPLTFSNEFKQADILVHCAALVHRSSKDLSKENYFKVNVNGTKNILQFLDKNKLRQIIFLSTVSVYGNSVLITAPDENTSINPGDHYGESKAKAEEEIRDYSMAGGIPYTILRLTPVYGKDFLLNIKKRIYLPRQFAFYKISSGNQKISLCSVNNCVEFICACPNRGDVLNETYIIKDIKDYSVNEIIEVFKNIFFQKKKPTVRIPAVLPGIIFRSLRLLLPKKGNFFIYQLNKVSMDSIYSGTKLHSLGINLNWDLENTLSAGR